MEKIGLENVKKYHLSLGVTLLHQGASRNE
jgi:hypothetical protein